MLSCRTDLSGKQRKGCPPRGCAPAHGGTRRRRRPGRAPGCALRPGAPPHAAACPGLSRTPAPPRHPRPARRVRGAHRRRPRSRRWRSGLRLWRDAGCPERSCCELVRVQAAPQTLNSTWPSLSTLFAHSHRLLLSTTTSSVALMRVGNLRGMIQGSRHYYVIICRAVPAACQRHAICSFIRAAFIHSQQCSYGAQHAAAAER